MKGIVKDLDKGFYEEARQQGKHPLTLLTELVKPEPPEIAAIEKRWTARLAKAHGLTELAGTPLENQVRELAYMLAGLEKEMAARGISRSDTVEKAFFSTANGPNQPLFPVFLASNIIAGQMAASLVPLFTMAEVRITSHVQEKVQITDTTDSRQTRHITEGQELPKTSIARSQGNITLQKYGRMLEASYEAVRLLHLDIIGLQLQRIGRQIGIDETDDMLETLIAGDGNAGTANTAINAATAGVLTYLDLISLYQGFPIGYEMRHAVTNDTELKQILNMAEFKDPLAWGSPFQRTGQLPGPMGATWHRWTSTGSSSFGTNKILAVDDRLACVLYREGDLLEEADQLIDKQLHRRTMSEWVGFMVWDPAGIQSLTI